MISMINWPYFIYLEGGKKYPWFIVVSLGSIPKVITTTEQYQEKMVN